MMWSIQHDQGNRGLYVRTLQHLQPRIRALFFSHCRRGANCDMVPNRPVEHYRTLAELAIQRAQLGPRTCVSLLRDSVEILADYRMVG